MICHSLCWNTLLQKNNKNYCVAEKKKGKSQDLNLAPLQPQSVHLCFSGTISLVICDQLEWGHSERVVAS